MTWPELAGVAFAIATCSRIAYDRGRRVATVDVAKNLSTLTAQAGRAEQRRNKRLGQKIVDRAHAEALQMDRLADVDSARLH